ncbi:MAG: hypothetical protein K1X79_07660 [Oligoflexia bacterium]|nr:hypothetical protein [Oligoflexia bacterium]
MSPSPDPQQSFEDTFPSLERALVEEACLRAQHESLCLSAGLRTCREPTVYQEIEAADNAQRIFEGLLQKAITNTTPPLAHARLARWHEAACALYQGIAVLDRRHCVSETGETSSRLLVSIKSQTPSESVIFTPNSRLYPVRGGQVCLHVSVVQAADDSVSIEALPLYTARAFLGELYLYTTGIHDRRLSFLPKHETFLAARAYDLARTAADAIDPQTKISGFSLNIEALAPAAQFSFHSKRGEIGVLLSMHPETGMCRFELEPDGILEA